MDTTGLAVSMATIFLGMFPEVQEKAYKEIAETIQDPKEITYENLSSLKYLDMVIKETMRLGNLESDF